MRVLCFLCVASIAAPAVAQIQLMELRYQDSGCADCAESLKKRLGRMRGVDEVTVDPAAGLIRMKLQPVNRVAFEQVRDFVEQGGSRIQSAALEVIGKITKDSEGWVLNWEGARSPLLLQGATEGLTPSDAERRLQGKLKETRPRNGQLTLIVDRLLAVHRIG